MEIRHRGWYFVLRPQVPACFGLTIIPNNCRIFPPVAEHVFPQLNEWPEEKFARVLLVFAQEKGSAQLHELLLAQPPVAVDVDGTEGGHGRLCQHYNNYHTIGENIDRLL